MIGCLALSWTLVAITLVKGMQVEQYLHDLDDLHDKFQRFGLISAGNSITVVFLFFFQSYGKVVYFITLFPYIVLTTFLIMGLQQVVC